LAGNTAGLFDLFSRLQERSRDKTGQPWPIITIRRAGLDGFWINRALVKEGIESHIVDAASTATRRRHRRVKTDRVDGETLLGLCWPSRELSPVYAQRCGISPARMKTDDGLVGNLRR
jgi:transposase